MAAHKFKVADNVAKKIAEIAKKMGGGELRVGFLEGATYPDGTPVAAAAYWANFGHGGRFPSPARPFFTNMINKESPSWPGKMAALAKATNNNGALVLRFMGEDIDAALKQSIVDMNDPPLSPTTLALRKKFGNAREKIQFADVLQAQKDAKSPSNLATGTQAKPLVWTGHMLNSTGYEVKK